MSPKRRNTSSPELSPSPPPKRLRPTYIPPSEPTFLSYDDPEPTAAEVTSKVASSKPNLTSNSPFLPAPPISKDDDDDEGSDSYSSAQAEPPSEQPRLDPIYGQRGAFPGLEGHDPDELFYGPASDGIEYLRMVRSEANTLPSLFVAQHESTPAPATPEEAVPPSRSERIETKANGASLATSTAPTRSRPITKEPGTSQQAYYEDLRLRYALLRATLKCTPPPESIASLMPSKPITFPRNSKEAYRQWKFVIKNVEPTMVQLACMDHDSVLRAIGLVSRGLESAVREAVAAGPKKTCNIPGAWCWGLLGRVRDVGELSSDEVGEIRDIGKAAVGGLNILRRYWERTAATEGKEGEVSEEESVESEEEWQGIIDNEDEAADDKGGEDDEDAIRGEFDGTTEVAQHIIDSADLTVTNGHSKGESINGNGTLQHSPSDVPTPSPPTLDLNQDLEAAKARLQGKLSTQDEEPHCDPEIDLGTESGELEEATDIREDDELKQVSAMLDMVVTIVGEAYGQRDLLDRRDVWAKLSS